jgi:BASS family bile acid:Na+ symporter
MIFLEQLPSLTLFVMMLAMGMGLEISDFVEVLRKPRAALLGVIGQLVALPLAALAIASLLGLPKDIAAGLMLIAVCPGGTSSNAITVLARGDVALSISLTTFSSFIAFLWVPLVLGWGFMALEIQDSTIELPFLSTTLRILFTTGLPVIFGIALRRVRPALAGRLERPLLNGSITILLLMIAGLPFQLAAESVDLVELFITATPAVLLLLVSTIAIALATARLFGVDQRQSITLGVEVGIQNFNLAMVLALSILAQPRLLGTAIVYLPAMFAFAGGLVWLGRRGTDEPIPAPASS